MDVAEVVRRDPRDGAVEGAVGEGQILRSRDDVWLHSRRGVGRDDLAAQLPQPSRDMAAAGGDVEHLAPGAWRAPVDD